MYVCGGSYIHGHPRDICDVYSFIDKEWTEGPTLATEISAVKMAGVGDTVIAVAGVGANISVQMLRTGENTWAETFPLPYVSYAIWIEDLLVMNDEEVLIPVGDYISPTKHLFLLSVVTGEARQVGTVDGCSHSFILSGQISCVRENKETEVLSVQSMDADYSNMEWGVVGTIPREVWPEEDYIKREVRVVEEMLTILYAQEGSIYYQEEGEWKEGGPLQILRDNPSSVVVNC